GVRAAEERRALRKDLHPALRRGQTPPQTSRAVSTTSASFARCASTWIRLPWTVDEKPHCGDRQSWSSGAYCAASSMRRFRSSLLSSSPSLVVTRPSTTNLFFGRKRSGLKSPERASSYSRKYASTFISDS